MKHIALIGNPNCGKSTLFNALTDSYEYVGNWPGVTVEKKIGRMKTGSHVHSIIDLPGIYTISPLTIDETVVSVNMLTTELDGIIQVINASQLERSSHLTIQLLEYQKPMILAVNMLDIANQQGVHIECEYLQQLWNIPVIPVIARNGQGIEALQEAICKMDFDSIPSFQFDYGQQIEDAITSIIPMLPKELTMSARWVAIQYLEGNQVVENWLATHDEVTEISSIRQANSQVTSDDSPLCMNVSLCMRSIRDVYIQRNLPHMQMRLNEYTIPHLNPIDRIVTHPIWGIPIFLLVMYLVFKITFDWLGSPISEYIGNWLDQDLTPAVANLLQSFHTSTFAINLITSGLISGVGGVLAFVPQIFLLFIMISIIEDSGYMARIAFIFDRFMQSFGLNGKSLIPMIIGFGCNVPGVMAARTIEHPQERLATMMLTPLMSCSARLPVYSLLVGTFFENHQSLIILSLYILGIIISLLLAFGLSLFSEHHEKSMFFVEWPSYHLPQWKTMWRSTWSKTHGFIRKAGTFIFAGTVVIWLLSYIGPTGRHVSMDQSLLAIVGGWIAPLFQPLGFASWETGVALITGFLAKEVVVSTLNVVYSSSDDHMLSLALSSAFTPLQAYSFMVFVLLYIPCIATVAVIHKETGSWKWSMFSIGYSLVVAYVVSFILYQVGLRWLAM